MFLESLGAGESIFGAFQTYAAQGLVLARVARSDRNRYHLLTENSEADSEPSGSFWYRSEDHASLPVVGDWVGARMVGPQQALVEVVLRRRTAFSRRAAGKRTEEQVIAANIDLVFLVCGLDGDFNLRRLERYLALASASGARPVVVLNKADLCAKWPPPVAETMEVAGETPVVMVSARTGEGLDGLRSHLAFGRTVALLGSSGAGKSTLINRLLGEDRLRTAEVRLSDSRGRHTTSHRELIPLPGGGALIDTPGMRELQLWAETENVEAAFDDIAAVARSCRFRDCSHAGDDGCAVEAAVRDGALSQERLRSFQKLIREAQRHEEMTDRLAAQERKAKVKQFHRALRRHYKLNR